MKKKTRKMPLTYDDPLTAVFLRILAWEQKDENRKPMRIGKDLANDILQTAREELGIKRNAESGGGQINFVKTLEKQGFLDGIKLNEDEWNFESAWRLKCLPSHRLVRVLSKNPVYSIDPLPTPTSNSDLIQIKVTLRNPALPELKITLGVDRPNSKKPGDVRGVYFLRVKDKNEDGLYIGKSDEFDVRWSQHTKLLKIQSKQVKWWAFIEPVGMGASFTLDALNAAESLLISFWNEICETTNKNRGHDKLPEKIHLQQGVLLVTAASAAFLWLLRENKAELKFDNFELPFKDCKANHWHECYLNPSNNSSEAD